MARSRPGGDEGGLFGRRVDAVAEKSGWNSRGDKGVNEGTADRDGLLPKRLRRPRIVRIHIQKEEDILGGRGLMDVDL